MQILLVTTNYWPEPTGIAVYTTDLAESLSAAGYQITVLTSLPHYPWWKIPSKFSHLAEGKSMHRKVSVIRARHFVPPKMNIFLRIRFETSLWRNLLRVSKDLQGNDFDLIIACIPTLAAGIVGRRFAQKFGIPFGLIVQDLSGSSAEQSGIRFGKNISKFVRFVEGKVINGTNGIVVISTAMRAVVEGLKVPQKRITQIINYSTREIINFPKEYARAIIGWPLDNFIVIHSGNIGLKQDLENVVRAADSLTLHTKIKFFLVGHGNQESRLKEICKDKQNIVILPTVSDKDYSTLLSAADLLLVNERVTQMEMSLPSKLTSYLYSERPVIAAVPRGGATWKFLDGIAELVEAGKPSLLADAIKELSQDQVKREYLASKGLEFARKNLDAEIGRRKYLDWVNSLIQSKRG